MDEEVYFLVIFMVNGWVEVKKVWEDLFVFCLWWWLIYIMKCMLLLKFLGMRRYENCELLVVGWYWVRVFWKLMFMIVC